MTGSFLTQRARDGRAPPAPSFARLLVLSALAGAALGAACTRGGLECPASASCPASDTTATIRGVVRSVSDGSPIEGATVATEPATLEVSTGLDGRFSLVVPVESDGSSYTVVASLGEERTLVSTGTLLPGGPPLELSLTLTRPADPHDPPDDPGPGSSDVDLRVSLTRSVFPCILIGEPLEFGVEVRNEGDAGVEGVVVHDTLSSPEAFQRALELSDIVVDRERFPVAVVEVNPEGFSFSVRLGRLDGEADDDGWTPVYTVSLPAGVTRAVWCNRVVAVEGEGRRLAEDTACVTTTLAIMFDREIRDGVLAPDGSFDGEPETFRVGDELAYRIRLRNDNCETWTGSRVVLETDPAGIVAYRDPVDGFPTRGTVTGTGGGRLVWEVGDLAFEESAVLVVRAEALAAGETVALLTFTSPDLRGDLRAATTTRVEP